MITPYVWIVEMEQRGKWEPCLDAYFTKGEALRGGIPRWEDCNPNDKFRVRKYVSAGEQP